MNRSRRRFIRNVSLAGGALTLGLGLVSCRDDPPPFGSATDFRPNAFLLIGADDSVVVQLPKAEMGQGVSTGIATLIAEELEVDPRRILIEMAPPHPAYRDPEYHLQVTGGSNAMRVYYDLMREAGASARGTLIAAAALESGIDTSLLRARQGRVFSLDRSFTASYGQLVATARDLPVPDGVSLKPAGDFQLIGHFDRRLDAAAKTDGSARFAIDVEPADCLTAVLVRSPGFGGRLVDFDAGAAMAVPGVVEIFPIEQGVAVVADGYWPARKAADQVVARFLPPMDPGGSSEDLEARVAAAFAQGEFHTVRKDAGTAPDPEQDWVQAEYRLPFLAHATMEPQNATAWVRGDHCELWVGSQAPDIARAAAARVLNCAPEQVTVHNHLLGGGFGRRVMPDVVQEVVAIAARLSTPVKLVFSREDDTRHDFYRPAMAGRLRARVSRDGGVSAWQHRIVGPSLNQQLIPVAAEVMAPAWVPGRAVDLAAEWLGNQDSASVEGAVDLPYTFDGVEVLYHNLPMPVPLGYWRSVGHSHTAFAVESFVDELANAAGEDPLAFRLRHLPADSRQARALAAAAGAASWAEPPAGRFLGVAVHESFRTVVAQVAEISLQAGQVRVEKYYCAVDCGRVINPDIVRDQMESGIVFALSAALYGEITLRDGAVVEGNFDDYPVLRHDAMPEVEVILLASDAPPSGVGEPATPPAAPALANAIFAATGKRLRRLPLRLEG